MADFDLDSFFSQRGLSALQGSDMAVPVEQAPVQPVQSPKVVALEQAIARRQHNLTNTVAAKVGLDAESFPGQAVNLAGSTANDLVKTFTLGNVNIDEYVPQNDDGSVQSSPQRRLVGDGALTGVKAAINVPEAATGIASLLSGGRAGKAVEEAGVRFRDAKEFLDTLLSPEQKAANTQVQGADGFVDTLGALVDRPSVVAHTVAESIPAMLAGGVVGRGAAAIPGISTAVGAAIGEGTMMAGSQAENIRNQTEDGLLTPTQQGLAAATGVMGGAVGMTGAKLAQLLRVSDVDEAIVKGSIDQAQRGALARIAGGTGIEAAEELVQSAGEKVAENIALDRDPMEGVGNAAAIGLAAGGVTGGGMNLLAKGPEKDPIAETNETDPAPFMDQQSPQYDPAKATRILLKSVRQEGVTEEQKTQTKQQVNTLMEQVESSLQSANLYVQASDPEALQTYRSEIAARKDQLAAMDPADAAHAQLNQEIQSLESGLATAEQITPEQRKQFIKQARTQQKRLEELKVLQGHLDNFTATEPVQPEAVQQVMDRLQVPETAPQASDELITLTMMTPDSVSDTQALQLADDVANSLSEAHRTYLRAFAAAKVAENSLKARGDVSSDVLNGGRGYVGIIQYRDRISTALRAGDVDTANQQLNKLRDFTKDRIAKLQAADQAYQQVRGTDQAVHLERLDTGAWRVRQTPFKDEAQRRANGGLTIKSNSGRLVATLQEEASVAQKAFAQLRSGVTLKGENTPQNQQYSGAISTTTPSVVESTDSVKPDPVIADEATQVKETEESSVSDAALTQTPEVVAVQSDPITAVSSPTVPVDTDPPRSGKLALFERAQEKSDALVEYVKKNLIAEYFRQKDDKVLSQQADLLSQLTGADAKALIDQYAQLSDNETVRANQLAALRQFVRFARDTQGPIRSLLARKADAQFNYQNLMTFFLDEQDQPDIDQNLKTAISLAAFTWLAENGNKTSNTKDDINALLGRDSKHPVTPDEQARFGQIGVRARTVADSLGQRVYQALGLTTQKDIPFNLRPQLISHLGEYASALLVKQGLLERTGYDGTLFEGVGGIEEISEAEMKAKHFFLRPVQTEGSVHPQIESIIAANRGTEGVVANFFAVDTVPLEPSFEPKPFKQKMAKNAQMQVPSILAEILDKEQSKPHATNKDMLFAVNALDRELVEQVMGVDLTPEAQLHVSNRKGVEAKNKALRTELSNALDFFEKLMDMPEKLDTPFYFQREVWRQQRVGLRERLFNPQTSKIHRHMMNMQGWKTTVKLDDQPMVDNFKVAVMEAMGTKTDKQPNSKTVADFDGWFASAEVQVAVQALDAALNGEATAEGQQTILAVLAGKEGMFSLDALIQVSKYKAAQDNKQPAFDTHFFREVDGKTNGPILAILQLGAAATPDALYGMLNRGGMYSESDKANHYSEYRAQSGAADLYEMLAKEIHERIGTMQMDALFAHVSRFTGALMKGDEVSSAGRNLVKTPLTAMVFGAGVKGTVENMAEAFVQKIYDSIQDRSDLAGVLTAVNAMLSEEQRLNTRMSKADALELTFNPTQLSQLKSAFDSTIGQAVEATLKEKFAVFLQRRQLLNNAAQTSFELYNVAYKAMKQQLIEELMATNQLPSRTDKNGKKVPVADITEAQDQELRQRLKALEPVVHTPLSKMAGSLEAGLYLAKETRSPSTDPVYEGQLNFPAGSFQQKSLKAAAYQNDEINPGVAALIMMIHSGDSAISSLAYQTSQALNVHDAHGLGLWEVEAGAKRLNQNTFTVMRDYSAPSELFAALERTVTAFADLVQSGELDMDSLSASDLAGVKNVLNQSVRDLPDSAQQALAQDPLTNFMRLIKRTAFNADRTRLGSMAKAKSYDQYSMEGGSYTVSDQDRAEAKNLLEQLEGSIDPVVLDKVGEISQRLKLRMEGQVTVKTQQISRMGVTTQAPAVALNQVEKQLTKDNYPEIQEGLEQVRAQMRHGKTLEEAAQVLDVLTESEVIQQVADAYNPRKHTEMGELGSPVLGLERVDQGLEAMLVQKPDLTARELMQAMYPRLKGTGNLRSIQRELLKELNRTVADVQVHYVTEATDPSSLKGDLRKVSGARGWYVAATDGDHVYLRSSEFKDAGVIPEVILHELVHAAVTRTIRDAQKAGKGDAFALVQDLERIRARATDHVKEKGLEGKYGHVVESLDEFIAWGMTNAGFQREVLNDFSMQSKTKGNALIEAARAFWETLSGLIFRHSDKTKQQQATRALTLVMKDVGGLFEAARQSGRGPQQAEETLAYDGIQYLTTREIFDHLSAHDHSFNNPAFAERLSKLLDTVVGELHGPFGSYKVEAEKQQALTEDDVFLKALDTGVLPFASQTLAANFKLSMPEAYVLEQVEVSLREGLSREHPEGYPVVRALEKLHREARDKVRVQDLFEGDWSRATQDEKDLAQAKWDHLFKVEGDRDDHLARFAALALASKELQPLLQFETHKLTDTPTGIRWLDALYQVFEKAMQLINGRLVKAYAGQQADQKLNVLIDQLVSIESKHKRLVLQAGNTLPDILDRSLVSLSEKGRERLEAFGKSDIFARSKLQTTKALGAGLSAVAGDRVPQIMNAFQKIRDTNFKTRQGVLSHMMTELQGQTDTNVFAHVLLQLASRNEQVRQQIKSFTGKAVLEGFANQGRGLTEQTKEAITKTLLRTDMQSLLDHFSTAQLTGLVQDKAQREKAIADFEARLKQVTNDPRTENFYQVSAKETAHLMVTGKAKGTAVYRNTYQMARLWGSSQQGKVTDAQAKAVQAILEPLVSLYALDMSPSLQLDRMNQVIQAEQERTDGGNGIELTLKLHRQLQEDAKARVFKDSEALMVKGYTPEIYNPYVEITAADAQEGRTLARSGWTAGTELELDAADPDRTSKRLYVVRSGGMQRRLTGAVSLTDTRAQGSLMHSGANGAQGPRIGNRNNTLTVHSQKLSSIDAKFDPKTRFDTRAKGANMVPVFNPNGTIVNWRYLMNENTKDTLLERNNAFEEVLGTFASQTFDKESSPVQNRKVIEALKEQFDAEYLQNPERYVMVGPNAGDREQQENWRLLPANTQQAIKEIWGKDAMFVRIDLLDMMFGYKMPSLSTAFTKDAEERSLFEKLMVDGLTGVVFAQMKREEPGLSDTEREAAARKVALRIRKAEDMWQEVVQELKDIVVVRNVVTLLGNIKSNLSLLLWQGVSPRDMIRHHRVAIRGAIDYRQDNAELIRLKMLRASGYVAGGMQAIDQEIALLEDAIARNPVRELIEAGLMPTIVEDVGMADDSYSYKTVLASKLAPVTDKVPAPLKRLGKLVYMSRDTTPYQFLAQATQLSDFVARYTLFQYQTTRAVNPLSREAALRQATEAFINYDVPTHRAIQYLNNMGILPFTKYYMRIQKVIFQLWRENPARAMALLAFNMFFDGVQTVMDSSFLARAGNNPLEWGAINYPQALGELPLVKVGLSPFN